MKTLRERMVEKVFSRLSEMAASAGDGTDLTNMHQRLYREHLYYQHQHDKSAYIHNGLDIKQKIEGNQVTYASLNHNDAECTHLSIIKHRKPSDQIPFNYEEQVHVEKHKESPRGHGTDILYHHFLGSKHPLVTSEIQSDQGKEMWRKVSHRAIDDGHHVYYCGEDSKLVKINKTNVDHYLDKYHGDTLSHHNRHIIISKHKL